MLRFDKISGVVGSYCPPADKSVTHRALIMAAMAKGHSHLKNVLTAEDCLCTLGILAKLGVRFDIEDIEEDGRHITCATVISDGYENFVEPAGPLWCGNSGTTARLMAGVLAPIGINAELTGDESLKHRPMRRVTEPLSFMGANISTLHNDECLPILIKPAKMHAVTIPNPIDSAQVKCALSLAALQLDGTTKIPLGRPTRNHIEKMLPCFGARVAKIDNMIHVTGKTVLTPADFAIPGDISSAAFMIAAVYMFPGSQLTISSVGLNSTRTVILDILRSWGADISIIPTGEDSGNMKIKHSRLKGGMIYGAQSSLAIDELPVLAMLGLYASEPVIIKDASELRVKESDRIMAVAANLRALGAEVYTHAGGLAVYPLDDSKVKPDVELSSYGDHRIAMINVLLAKKYGLRIQKKDLSDINVSYPAFLDDLKALEVS